MKEQFKNITLYNADCMDVMRELPDSSIDAIISDPPYGIDFCSSWTNNHDKIANDGFEEFTEALPIWLAEFKRILTDTGCCCCCCCGGGNKPVSQIFTMEVVKAGFHLVQTLIWDKQTIGLGWRYRPSYETIIVFSKSKDYNWFDDSKKVSNIIRMKNIIPQKGDHPTPKPIDLMRRLIRLHTMPDMTVLDPFLGGGTTAIAADIENRKCIGVELKEEYYNLARKRLINHQMQKKLF